MIWYGFNFLLRRSNMKISSMSKVKPKELQNKFDIVVFNGSVEGSSFDNFVYDVETLSKKYSPYGEITIPLLKKGFSPSLSNEKKEDVKRVYCDKEMKHFFVSICCHDSTGQFIEKYGEFCVINKKDWKDGYRLVYDRVRKVYAIFVAE